MSKTHGVQGFTMTEAGVYAIGIDGTVRKDERLTRKHLGTQVAERNNVLNAILPDKKEVKAK